MFNGFVTTYKDTNGFIHLYFFPGIDDDGSIIYRKIDLSNAKIAFDEKILEDGSSDFRFINKTITSISCNLVNNKTGITTVDTLKI